ncbi:hypothetical protein QBC46DRAFT_165579 [Diplogelasinospora grovesii]|uniref:Uncharacterized protein n=1 Tax=Diplogelasinospora grovesii TaxID=303347 RepID=A0AAN6NGN2_9PEZI|nr:hypothetical protein QBC46DRAFT_165579 [Diplogelasinospora grovesii]
MSATPVSTPLPHRALANLRSPGGGSGGGQAGGGSGPSTPLRPINASTFASPSTLRAEEDLVIIEFGTRKLLVGFAGDPVPRGCIWLEPEQQRRVGDFRAWQTGFHDDWRRRASGKRWGRDHELWQYDVRGVDLGLVGDKLERALREAFTKYLLIDTRPRKMVCVLPSGLPSPLLSATLDTLFSKFQAPTISLLSSPATLTVAAGVRSALIVDLGWTETVVTSIYEYREVYCSRTVRGGRLLAEQTHKSLAKRLAQLRGESYDEGPDSDFKGEVLSFEECEDIASRMVWCKPCRDSITAQHAEGLPTVQEHDDEPESHVPSSDPRPSMVTVPLKSSRPPTSLELPQDALTEPCENAFFETHYSYTSFDDHELPVHLLVYRSLLQLPMDVRAICMSRIIFTGGCANVLGLRQRIFDEVSSLVRQRGWDPVQGRCVAELRANTKLKKRATRQAGSAPTGVASHPEEGEEQDGVWHDAANSAPEVDPVEEQLKKGADKRPRVQGEMRAIESLGGWSGASILTQLKVGTIATVDRELWLQQGAAGASKASEVDSKTLQRQSLGAGGLIRGAAAGSNQWTLGVWGAT